LKSKFPFYFREQFYDVLKEEKFEEGQHIIKQGESGNKFYIVIEGNLVAEKKEIDDEFPRIVYQYKEGDYFGELALVHDIDRQASVKAINRVRVASINRESFKRMLGSFEEIIKRNEQKYNVLQEKTVCA
jgi:cAMP-dependent protein kinase regulator